MPGGLKIFLMLTFIGGLIVGLVILVVSLFNNVSSSTDTDTGSIRNNTEARASQQENNITDEDYIPEGYRRNFITNELVPIEREPQVVETVETYPRIVIEFDNFLNLHIIDVFIEIVNNRMVAEEITEFLGLEQNEHNLHTEFTPHYYWIVDDIEVNVQFFTDGELKSVSLVFGDDRDSVQYSFDLDFDVVREFYNEETRDLLDSEILANISYDDLVRAAGGLQGTPTSWQMSTQRWRTEQISYVWRNEMFSMSVLINCENEIQTLMISPQTLDSLMFMQDELDNPGLIHFARWRDLLQ
jgi:hypothetical protein